MIQVNAFIWTLVSEGILLTCLILVRESLAPVNTAVSSSFQMWLIRITPPNSAFRISQILIAFAAANFISHPIAWHTYNARFISNLDLGWYLIEAGVVLLESLVYRALIGLHMAVALFLSLILNLASIALGTWFF